MPFTLFWTKTTGRGTLMNIRRVRQENQLLINLVFRLLPVQALIVAMGSINSLVDGVAAARSISPAMIGVIGLYYSLLRILEAVSAVLLGGSAVLCGRYMGRGKIDKTTGIFSLNLSMAFICGAVVTILSLAARSLVINRVLLVYSGNEGLAAMTVFNMISGLLLALPLGAGAVVRMLTILTAFWPWSYRLCCWLRFSVPPGSGSLF
ncbi:MAG: hypothetical protein E7239_03240 [Sarcina sp.]|nr:hypothetical protein [Sarcina sp.]